MGSVSDMIDVAVAAFTNFIGAGSTAADSFVNAGSTAANGSLGVITDGLGSITE